MKNFKYYETRYLFWRYATKTLIAVILITLAAFYAVEFSNSLLFTILFGLELLGLVIANFESRYYAMLVGLSSFCERQK